MAKRSVKYYVDASLSLRTILSHKKVLFELSKYINERSNIE